MSPGCSNGPVLWRRCVPAEQLECAGWRTGFCVPGGHSGLHGISRWKSNPGHVASPSLASHPTAAQVGRWNTSSCLLH